jgi:hypothetical protein
MGRSREKPLSRGRHPFPLLDQLPDALRGVILDFHWDLDRLHALRLPETRLPVQGLAWHLELPFWSVEGRPFRVSPAEVAATPDRFSDHWTRTLGADLSFSLDGRIRSDGRVVLLDGVHRLLKASILRQPTVSVRILRESQFDAIAHRAR